MSFVWWQSMCRAHVLLWNNLRFDLHREKWRQVGSPVGEGRRQIMCWWGGNQETVYIILKWSSALFLSGGFWRNLHKCTYNPEVQSYIQIIQTACSQEESVGCELINLNLFVYTSVSSSLFIMKWRFWHCFNLDGVVVGVVVKDSWLVNLNKERVISYRSIYRLVN